MLRQALLAAIASSLLIPLTGYAEITFLSIGGQELKSGTAGSADAPVGSLVLLVAHVGDDNTGVSAFGDFHPGTLNIGDFIDTSSRTSGHDLIVQRYTLPGPDPSISDPGVFFAQFQNFTLSSGWAAGDSVALYWIPSLDGSSFSVAENVSFGRYTNDTVDGGSSAWLTPADTEIAESMFFATIDSNYFGAINADPSAGYAAFVTVPEPSEYALLGITLVIGLLVLRRQRNRLALGQATLR